jgi:hypothetical protein
MGVFSGPCDEKDVFSLGYNNQISKLTNHKEKDHEPYKPHPLMPWHFSFGPHLLFLTVDRSFSGLYTPFQPPLVQGVSGSPRYKAPKPIKPSGGLSCSSRQGDIRSKP